MDILGGFGRTILLTHIDVWSCLRGRVKISLDFQGWSNELGRLDYQLQSRS